MFLFVLLAIVLAMPGSARAQAADAPLAPELTGLGTIHLAVTTSVPRAQRFFDQGLRLLYARAAIQQGVEPQRHRAALLADHGGRSIKVEKSKRGRSEKVQPADPRNQLRFEPAS